MRARHGRRGLSAVAVRCSFPPRLSFALDSVFKVFRFFRVGCLLEILCSYARGSGFPRGPLQWGATCSNTAAHGPASELEPNGISPFGWSNPVSQNGLRSGSTVRTQQCLDPRYWASPPCWDGTQHVIRAQLRVRGLSKFNSLIRVHARCTAPRLPLAALSFHRSPGSKW